MIVVKIMGGLANRMFQYAMYLAIKNVREDVYIDETSFQPMWSFEKVSLKDTFPQISAQEDESNVFWPEKKQGTMGKIIRHLYENFSSKYCKEKVVGNYDPLLISNLPKVCYVTGYWQSEKYFKGAEEQIRRDFKFQKFTETKNIEISEKMQNENAVAIHVRKGKDYQRNNGVANETCPLSYYKEAINYIIKNVEDPVFYVFSDNKDWCKENLSFINYTLVDWNPVSGPTNYRDIQLMSCCKHNIIANSSFSWWGAWLNNNAKKIVIAPKLWFNPSTHPIQPKDIICESWIKM